MVGLIQKLLFDMIGSSAGVDTVVEEKCCAKNGASDCEIHVRWS